MTDSEAPAGAVAAVTRTLTSVAVASMVACDVQGERRSFGLVHASPTSVRTLAAIQMTPSRLSVGRRAT
jgi:hypothetical protein